MTTLCPYCGIGCGLKIDGAKIKGDPSHPSSLGDVCKKPLYLVGSLNKQRLLTPLYREDKKDNFRQISWQEAYEILAQKLNLILPDKNYFYLSGQLLTEESYVFNKFVKGFLGTNNIDANSRLCMASAVVAHKIAFGSDGPLGSYEDIDDTDVFIFAGSNAAIAHPVLFKRVLKRKRSSKAKIIVLDPVFTQTAEKADLYIPINAGTDTAFFNCVLALICENENDEALEYAKNFSVDKTASICGVDKNDILAFAKRFSDAGKVLSFWCQGLNQSTNGVAKNLALINLHIATNRVNAVRGLPFSLTGQPNAMGGREVGYLSSSLPGYRDVRALEDREFMQKFWRSATQIKETPGLTVTKAIDAIIENKISFFWSVCTNPAVSLPNLNKVFNAFSKKDLFLVVQDAYFTDTCKYANLILPAAQWGEKEGSMTNSERVVTHLKKAFNPPGLAKSDWQICCDLADKLGFAEFKYASAKEIFSEFALSTKNRLCDISKFSYEKLPMQWGEKNLYANGFSKPLKLIKAEYSAPKPVLGHEFTLTTGRLKNQWHTMTRTGKSEELLMDEKEPFALINETDANRLGIKENDIKTLISKYGRLRVKLIFGGVKESHLFMPFGWGATKKGFFNFFRDFEGAVNILTSDESDPLSFQPELKFVMVKIF